MLYMSPASADSIWFVIYFGARSKPWINKIRLSLSGMAVVPIHVLSRKRTKELERLCMSDHAWHKSAATRMLNWHSHGRISVTASDNFIDQTTHFV